MCLQMQKSNLELLSALGLWFPLVFIINRLKGHLSFKKLQYPPSVVVAQSWGQAFTVGEIALLAVTLPPFQNSTKNELFAAVESM